jgi:hypothetical protein
LCRCSSFIIKAFVIGYDRGELLDEFLRREDDVRRAVSPAVFQAIEQAAVVES